MLSSQSEDRVTMINVMRTLEPVFPDNRAWQTESLVDRSRHVFGTLWIGGGIGSDAI